MMNTSRTTLVYLPNVTSLVSKRCDLFVDRSLDPGWSCANGEGVSGDADPVCENPNPWTTLDQGCVSTSLRETVFAVSGAEGEGGDAGGAYGMSMGSL